MQDVHLTQIRSALERFSPIPDAEWAHFAAGRSALRLAAGEHLLHLGDPVRHLWFLHEGALRVYYMRGGREHTRSFAFGPRFYTNSFAALTGGPSHYAVEALEDCLLSALPHAAVEDAYDRHRCWDRIGRCFAQENFVRKERKEMEMRLYTPEERYRRLLAEGSPLVRRVPLYHLASYLGIAPETLSRIRGRMARVGGRKPRLAVR